MSAVPTVYGTLSRVPVDADISSLRLPIVGASPLPPSVREDFAAHTGRRLLEGYGLTEATCATTATPPGGERTGSVGRALPGQQVKAVHVGDDGSWTDCAPGETGVLAIGGPAVFAGYVTDPAQGGVGCHGDRRARGVPQADPPDPRDPHHRGWQAVQAGTRRRRRHPGGHRRAGRGRSTRPRRPCEPPGRPACRHR
jgi:acyl-CoA synthetase (AMP-forming)/AMP-acid ligase II